MEHAAHRYGDGLQRAGLQPNRKLTRAMAERARESAYEDYEKQSYRTFKGNIDTILSDYHQRDRQIKREGARMAWLICPFAMLLFGFVSWFNFHQGDVNTGLLSALGSLAFLLMLVLASRRR
jgi:hypothetical protein